VAIADDARFTTEAWEAIADWRSAVEGMPFIRSLADGSLPADAFAFYLWQDAAYLTEFSRVLSTASILAPHPDAQRFFASSAHIALEVELGLHRDWLSAHPVDGGEPGPSPVTAAYTNHLLAASVGGSYPVIVAAVLPCYWLYAYIGEALVKAAGDLGEHPYQRWIATYGDPAFQESADTARRLVDEAAAPADASTRRSMLDAFVRSAMYEYLFFDQALTKPQWPTAPSQHAEQDLA
jgi:hydroxymethylpyrimidine/phosphomethylpyrimidine kinase